ncbi:MAG: VOC family protein [Rhizobiaceae bacterium]
MSHLIGPDFIGIQAYDLDAARNFYSGVLGMEVIDGPPDAVVFDSKPIKFAVRTPLIDIKPDDKMGLGIALWFACDDAEALCEMLVEKNVPIAFPPKDGPFGRYFAFIDPFGYTITAHTAMAA